LERAVILAGEGTLRLDHLPPQLTGAPSVARGGSPEEGSYLKLPVGVTVDEAERALIELTLEYTNQNKTRAAEILGISQKTLFNKLKEYGAREGASA
jgi:DNA-binding NtrC family response regulator